MNAAGGFDGGRFSMCQHLPFQALAVMSPTENKSSGAGESSCHRNCSACTLKSRRGECLLLIAAISSHHTQYCTVDSAAFE